MNLLNALQIIRIIKQNWIYPTEQDKIHSDVLTSELQNIFFAFFHYM